MTDNLVAGKRINDRSIQSIIDKIFSKKDYQYQIDELYKKLKVKTDALLTDGVDISNLLLLTDQAMREVGKFKNLLGYEKKALVMTTVRKLAQDRLTELHLQSEDLAENLEAELKSFVDIMDLTLDSFIDQLYELSPDVYGTVEEVKKRCPCSFWKCC